MLCFSYIYDSPHIKYSHESDNGYVGDGILLFLFHRALNRTAFWVFHWTVDQIVLHSYIQTHTKIVWLRWCFLEICWWEKKIYICIHIFNDEIKSLSIGNLITFLVRGFQAFRFMVWLNTQRETFFVFPSICVQCTQRTYTHTHSYTQITGCKSYIRYIIRCDVGRVDSLSIGNT